MKKYIIGIDLGSSKTTIYSSNSRQIIFDEPTCVAVSTKSKEVREIGYLASKIAGKTPYNFDVIFPVKNGIVEDDELVYELLQRNLNNLRLEKRFRNFSLIFSTSSNCSKVNRDVLVSIGRMLQAREIYIEPQSKLAAIGVGNDVFSPNATLICNIGSGVTDIAVVSMGEIVASTSTFISSSTLDEEIRRYISTKQHLSIGLSTAEYVKMKVGDVSAICENKLFDVKGRNMITYLPSSIVVSSSEIKKVLEPTMDFIALKITDVISKIPPELSADLLKNGLLLTGGGAQIAGISEYFSKTLSLPVKVAKDPSTAVIRGMKNLIDKMNEGK